MCMHSTEARISRRLQSLSSLSDFRPAKEMQIRFKTAKVFNCFQRILDFREFLLSLPLTTSFASSANSSQELEEAETRNVSMRMKWNPSVEEVVTAVAVSKVSP